MYEYTMCALRGGGRNLECGHTPTHGHSYNTHTKNVKKNVIYNVNSICIQIYTIQCTYDVSTLSNSTAVKTPLTDIPFVVKFRYVSAAWDDPA